MRPFLFRTYFNAMNRKEMSEMTMTDNLAIRIAMVYPFSIENRLVAYYKNEKGCNDEEALNKARTLIDEAKNHIMTRIEEEFKPRKKGN